MKIAFFLRVLLIFINVINYTLAPSRRVRCKALNSSFSNRAVSQPIAERLSIHKNMTRVFAPFYRRSQQLYAKMIEETTVILFLFHRLKKCIAYSALLFVWISFVSKYSLVFSLPTVMRLFATLCWHHKFIYPQKWHVISSNSDTNHSVMYRFGNKSCLHWMGCGNCSKPCALS